MNPAKLHALYRNNIEGKRNDLIQATCLTPLIVDMQENDPILFDRLVHIVAEYNKNLCVRIVESRQLSFDFAEDENEEESKTV